MQIVSFYIIIELWLVNKFIEWINNKGINSCAIVKFKWDAIILYWKNKVTERIYHEFVLRKLKIRNTKGKLSKFSQIICYI